MSSPATKKKKLVLITDEFPYSLAESSFVPPELPYLIERFDVTVLSKSDSKRIAVDVDPEIALLHYERPHALSHIPGMLSALFTDDFQKERAEIRSSGKHRMLRFSVSAYFAAEARFFDQFLTRHGFYGENAPDLFYSYWNNYAVYALACAKREGRTQSKLVTRTHGYDLYDARQIGGRQPMKRQTDREIDRVFFVSEQGRRYYLEHHADGAAPEKYALARMGVPALSSCPRPEKGAPLSVLTCSRTLPVKRLPLLIDALSQINSIPVRWTHVGDGPEKAALASRAEKLLGPMENVAYTFTGWMKNADYLSLLESRPFSCLVNVSSSEGLPVTMMEAASAGLPVIATDVGGVKEIVSDKNGVLLPADVSAEGIARALTDFYALPEAKKSALSAGAKEVFSERFNAAQNYAAFADALYRLVNA